MGKKPQGFRVALTAELYNGNLKHCACCFNLATSQMRERIFEKCWKNSS